MLGDVLRLIGVILGKIPDPDDKIRKSNRLGRLTKARAILQGKLLTDPSNLKLQARLSWVETEILRLHRELGTAGGIDGSDSEAPGDTK